MKLVNDRDPHVFAETRIGAAAWYIECACGWSDVSHSADTTGHLRALHLEQPEMETREYRKMIEDWKHPVTGKGVLDR